MRRQKKNSRWLTADEARTKAKKLRVDVESGVDPLAVKKEELSSPTVNAVLDTYFQEAETRALRPNTLRSYGVKVLPDGTLVYKGNAASLRKKFGQQHLKTITRADLVKLHHALGKTAPYQANRMLALLSVLYTYAMHPDRAWVTKNIVVDIERHLEEKRKRYLKPAEVERFYAALDAYVAEHKGTRHERQATDAVNALCLLLYTGSRLNEVLGAQWHEFDLDRKVWMKPAERMKTGEDVEIPLSAPALELLEQMQPSTGPLFRGRHGKKARVSINRPWNYVLKHAGLSNLRRHDLRHSFASFAISHGVPLAVVGGLLSHKSTQTTAKYAHLLNDALREGTDTVGSKVLAFRRSA